MIEAHFNVTEGILWNTLITHSLYFILYRTSFHLLYVEIRQIADLRKLYFNLSFLNSSYEKAADTIDGMLYYKLKWLGISDAWTVTLRTADDVSLLQPIIKVND